MNLNQLYYLQAIAQARGLTRAADALYVTQSNLSHSMAALEEELGIPLLYKNGRDTLLTPYGQEFLAYAERAIQEIEEGKRVAQSRCSPTRGQVRLGFISAVSATLIPWCVSHFYQNPDNQGITFTFDEKPTRRIAADFTHHALDIGFGTRFDDSSFEFCPVVPEELVAVVPAGHPLAQQEQVTLEQLSRERLVIYKPHPQSGAVHVSSAGSPARCRFRGGHRPHVSQLCLPGTRGGHHAPHVRPPALLCPFPLHRGH